MNVEEISFINDVIQDNRANARTEQRYYDLIELILTNAKLNWNGDGLILRSDEKLFDYIKLIEPADYKNAFDKIKREEEEQEKNK